MKTDIAPEIIEKAKKIKLLLMDCDGVLTDGNLYYSETGESLKVFNVKDGQGLVAWHQAGFESGIISGRSSKILTVRATELGMSFIRVGSRDKIADFEEIFEQTNAAIEEIAFIGDDIPDIKLMEKVGLSIAVADAVEAVIKTADLITRKGGGSGAVREIVDFLLLSKAFEKSSFENS